MTSPIGPSSTSQVKREVHVQPSVPSGVGAAPTTITAAPKEKGYILSAVSAVINRVMQFFKNIYHFIASCFGTQSSVESKDEETKPQNSAEEKRPWLQEEFAILRAFEKLSEEEQSQAYYKIGKAAGSSYYRAFTSWETIGKERARENLQLLRPYVTERAIEEQQYLPL